MKMRSVGMLAALYLTCGSALAGTPVNWSLPSLNSIVPAGGSRQVTFMFEASEDIGNITFRVVPELLPYVQISPAAISNVVAGSSTVINVTLKAGLTTQSFAVNGVIQARAASGAQKVFAQPLPVQLMIRVNPIADFDADGNGIWDYVDQYINTTYANDPEIVPALQQFARSFQAALLDAKDADLSLQHSGEADRAIECIFSYRIRRGAEAAEIIEKLKAAMLNTRERSLADAIFSEHSAGHVFANVPVGQERTSCNS